MDNKKMISLVNPTILEDHSSKHYKILVVTKSNHCLLLMYYMPILWVKLCKNNKRNNRSKLERKLSQALKMMKNFQANIRWVKKLTRKYRRKKKKDSNILQKTSYPALDHPSLTIWLPTLNKTNNISII